MNDLGVRLEVVWVMSTIAGPSSAFEKWSGHVEPEGSRMGVFRDLHERKIGFTVFRSDFIAS